MARKKIREYDSKRLLKAHILRLKGLKLPLNVAQVLSNAGLDVANFSEGRN
jgi:ATP citrate (pro-S)-lyase